jgi:hypothetical protein
MVQLRSLLENVLAGAAVLATAFTLAWVGLTIAELHARPVRGPGHPADLLWHPSVFFVAELGLWPLFVTARPLGARR